MCTGYSQRSQFVADTSESRERSHEMSLKCTWEQMCFDPGIFLKLPIARLSDSLKSARRARIMNPLKVAPPFILTVTIQTHDDYIFPFNMQVSFAILHSQYTENLKLI